MYPRHGINASIRDQHTSRFQPRLHRLHIRHAKGRVPADGRVMREAITKGEAGIGPDDMQPAIVVRSGQHGQLGGVYAEIATLGRSPPAPFFQADNAGVKRYGFPHFFGLEIHVMDMPGRAR